MLSSVCIVFLLSMVYLAKAAMRDPTPKVSRAIVAGSIFGFSYVSVLAVVQPAGVSSIFRVFLFSTLMFLHLFYNLL